MNELAGIAQVILTDHELDTLIEWGRRYIYHDKPAQVFEKDMPLWRKLRGFRRTLKCGCCNIDSCAV